MGIVPPWALLIATLAIAVPLFPGLLAKVDYGLLLTFVFFFVFAENIHHLQAVSEAIASWVDRSPLATAVAASQVISNVPTAVLLSGFTPDAAALVAGTNIGGLGTPIGSLASIISLKFFLRAKVSTAPRYLGVFSAVNFALLALLCAFAWAVGLA